MRTAREPGAHAPCPARTAGRTAARPKKISITIRTMWEAEVLPSGGLLVRLLRGVAFLKPTSVSALVGYG
jgi:hypothetical protein